MLTMRDFIYSSFTQSGRLELRDERRMGKFPGEEKIRLIHCGSEGRTRMQGRVGHNGKPFLMIKTHLPWAVLGALQFRWEFSP